MKHVTMMIRWSMAVFLGLLLLAEPLPLRAQNSAAPAKVVTFGGFGALNINQHTASFNSLPGVPIGLFNGSTSPLALDLKNKVQFGDATGFGFTIGGLADIPLADALSLSLRVSYATHNAVLQATEDLRNVGFLNAQGTGVSFFSGKARFTLTPNLGSVGIEPLLAWSPIAAAPNFRIYGGARVGFMIQTSFSQSEQLLDPVDNAVWNNLSLDRNNIPGQAIPNVQSVNFVLTGGLGYDIPIGRFVLAPEAFYSYSLTPFINGTPIRFVGASLCGMCRKIRHHQRKILRRKKTQNSRLRKTRRLKTALATHHRKRRIRRRIRHESSKNNQHSNTPTKTRRVHSTLRYRHSWWTAPGLKSRLYA